MDTPSSTQRTNLSSWDPMDEPIRMMIEKATSQMMEQLGIPDPPLQLHPNQVATLRRLSQEPHLPEVRAEARRILAMSQKSQP